MVSTLRLIRFTFLNTLALLLTSGILCSQDSRLANEYYQSGEYLKAATVYKQLFEKSRGHYSYFSRYIESLLAVDAFDEAEQAIKEQIKTNPRDMNYYVSYGNLYEKKFEPEKADAQFKKAIDNLTADIGQINKLGNAFSILAKHDLAIETYEKGQKLIGEKHSFAPNLAALYQKKGNYGKMIYYYLDGIKIYEKNMESLENTLSRVLPAEGMDTLQIQLYQRIQSEVDEPLYTELLEWTFIHRKQYDKALRQARAMDRKLEENGYRVYNIAGIAANDKAYEVAMDAYQYIIDYKGTNSTFYMEAKLGLLNARRRQITKDLDFSPEALRPLELDYENFLAEFGSNSQSATMMRELAYLKAYYLDNIDGGISLLEEVITFGGLNPTQIAESKIELADLFLIKGDIWEATLLYSQVDKAFPEGTLGENARFKNARLSYFNGDFEWAQAQFDILKTATTRLISNDAIEMSVFITDNVGLDTTDIPVKMYAEAEMLLYQNKHSQALDKLTEIEKTFVDHSLIDDIWYLRAQIFNKQKNFTSAVEAYQLIIENHYEEIRADNALFELAELNERALNDPKKAMTLYEQLFNDFANSTLATEARKRFRLLRGDDV